MDNVIELADHFEQMNKVVAEFIKGNNPNQIAKQLALKPAQVTQLLNNWRELIQGDSGIKERAREALGAADQHYSMIINEAWNADVEQKRIDMLQKAGVLEKNDMADAILETERKQEVLVGILRDVTSSCNTCKQEVARRLKEVTGKVEVINVD